MQVKERHAQLFENSPKKKHHKPQTLQFSIKNRGYAQSGQPLPNLTDVWLLCIVYAQTIILQHYIRWAPGNLIWVRHNNGHQKSPQNHSVHTYCIFEYMQDLLLVTVVLEVYKVVCIYNCMHKTKLPKSPVGIPRHPWRKWQ